MGFFDKLSSFASKCAESQARSYENIARSGYVGDRKLSSSQRNIANQKAAGLYEAAERLRRDD